MQNRTVLFVDDDRITLKSLEWAMQDEPYRSLYALSGSQALDIMAGDTVDVIVTDLMMPEMDGMMLLDWVQAEYPDVIRVVLSSLSDTTSILEAINSGSVYRYIVKPWNRDELKITVRQALELFAIQKEKKGLLDQLEINNQLLEQRVAERTQQLLDIDSQAEIGKHVSQIVHNLNSPLQAIFGTVDLAALKLSIDSPDLEKIVQLLNRTKSSAMDLEKIIRSILLHARTSSLAEAVEVDINGIITSELEFFKINPVFNREIDKQVNLIEPAPIIIGNPVQIKQVVNNLITNAIDAMEACSPKRLSVATRVQNSHVELSIADTGAGIETNDIAKIFSPDFTTKPVGKGTGLGLASVKTMVEAYNGSISVESQKGEGATFNVRLPLAGDSGLPAA
ncbi:MAG: hybrid sensor histidine kinase/response regulator [Desulfobacterales bacterium]|nr:hybrid sensor histidine kinase/response regulator [Desulfobacterales bacterium]